MATIRERLVVREPASDERRRRVLNLALPAVGEQVLNTLVGMVDVFLIGHLSLTAAAVVGYSSAQALAGAGLATQMVWIANVLFAAVGIGATALVARARGADDLPQAGLALRQSLLIGAAAGLLAMLLVPLAPHLLAAMGATPDVLAISTHFFSISAIGFIPTAVLLVGMAALRGTGDTRTPLVLMLGVNVVNMVCSWFLINGNFGAPILGAVGGATGAVVGRTLGALALLFLLSRRRDAMRLTRDLLPNPTMLRRILHIGAPSAGEQLVFQGALLIFVSFITALGTASYAAHNLVVTIESLSFLPGMGYGAAASALVGQALGASRADEAEATANEALLQSAILMSALGLVMALIPHQLLSLFVTDQAVIEAGAGPLRIAGLFQPMFAVNMVLSGALRGAGDTKWPLYIKFISTWVVRLPLVLVAAWLGAGLMGFWIAMGCDFFVQAMLTRWRFGRGVWKGTKV